MGMVGDMRMEGEMVTTTKPDNTASRLVSVPINSPDDCGPKVAVIDVDGLLVNKNIGGFGSMGENPVALFREKLDAIRADPDVSALVLRINSSGGGVTASDMMTRDLQTLKSERQLPVVACLMDVGTGGAYYLAAAADQIVAHPTSVVGGIGVILNVYYMEDALMNFGVVSIPIKSGDRIDVASPVRVMESEERDMLQQMSDRLHGRFIDHVSAARGVTDQQLFDGRVWTGDQAESLKLVDQVGYLDDAVDIAKSLAGLTEAASLVMLRRDNDRAYTLFDVTPNTPTMSSIIPLNIPGLDRSRLPTFLYLWQPDPSIATTAEP